MPLLQDPVPARFRRVGGTAAPRRPSAGGSNWWDATPIWHSSPRPIGSSTKSRGGAVRGGAGRWG